MIVTATEFNTNFGKDLDMLTKKDRFFPGETAAFAIRWSHSSCICS